MASCSQHHLELTNGEGKCSVPMWLDGCPAGFCDEPAYGRQTKEYLDSFKHIDPRQRRPSYAPGLACPMHGGPDKAEAST